MGKEIRMVYDEEGDVLDGSLGEPEESISKEQEKIRNIIHEAGLQRKRDDGEFYWEWRNPPRKGWEITWSGYREL